MKLKHIDLVEDCVHQDAREVKTKFSKTFKTYFFPVGSEITEIVVDWVRFLKEDKLWGNDDPLFPATEVTVGTTMQFESSGLKQEHWKSASPIRTIFREAFTQSGLPYFHPHSLRRTLVRFGEMICQSPEQFKAWSQNLGHEKVLTTFTNYGSVASHRQGEIIRELANPNPRRSAAEADIAEAVFQRFKQGGLALAVPNPQSREA